MERLPFDIFHYQIVSADVVQSTDVRVIEGSDGVRFPLKPLGKLSLAFFDRDDAIQTRILGLINVTHPAE